MGGAAAGGSGIYLLIAQIILLAVYYGLHWTSMPWWVVFLPAIVWLARAVIVVFIILECVILAACATMIGCLRFRTGNTSTVIIGIILNGVLIYGL